MKMIFRERKPILRCSSPRTLRWDCAVLIALAMGLAWISPAHAQSKDSNHPAPLLAGVNAGNVNNFEGAHYYYFYAGPGKFKIRMTFKATEGLYGNPLKQYLDIDLWGDQGNKIGYSRMVSTNEIKESSTGGDFNGRYRVRISVTPQKAAIRLGGRYEIEVTGAADFDAPGRADPTNVKSDTDYGALLQGSSKLLEGDSKLVEDGKLLEEGKAIEGNRLLARGSSKLLEGPSKLLDGPSKLLSDTGPLLVTETEKEIRLALAADVLFDFDSATIRPDAAAALEQAAEVIRKRSRGVVRVEGHTDSKGTGSYNKRLSEKRAVSVKNWLASNAGLGSQKFHIIAFGESRPVAPNTTPDGQDDPVGRQRNRRVELLIAK